MTIKTHLYIDKGIPQARYPLVCSSINHKDSGSHQMASALASLQKRQVAGRNAWSDRGLFHPEGSLEKLPDRPLIKFTKGKSKVLHMLRNKPLSQNCLENSFLWRTWGSWWTASWVWTSSVHRKANGIQSWVRQSTASRLREGILPLSTTEAHPQGGTSSGLPGGHRATAESQQRATMIIKGLETPLREEWELGLLSLEKRMLREGSNQCAQTPEGRVQEMEPGSFLCPMMGPEAMDTNQNRGGSLWQSGNAFSLGGWLAQSTHRGCRVSILGDIQKLPWI